MCVTCVRLPPTPTIITFSERVNYRPPDINRKQFEIWKHFSLIPLTYKATKLVLSRSAKSTRHVRNTGLRFYRKFKLVIFFLLYPFVTIDYLTLFNTFVNCCLFAFQVPCTFFFFFYTDAHESVKYVLRKKCASCHEIICIHV